MPETRPLLMIPGPVEISPAVLAAVSTPPPSHTSRELIDAFAESLAAMRRVWQAGPESHPFVVAGGGTAAMEMAAANLVEPGDGVLVADTGYFGARMAEILRRLGARVRQVAAPVGEVPPVEAIAQGLAALEQEGPAKALFATHVDTSTGVRLDPEPLARLAREHGLLSVVDGVCATGGERFEMAAWEADVYLTGSQKALGLPPGLALLVASPRALETRARRSAPPPSLYLDWHAWRPILAAYEEHRPSYFSTPPTQLILALRTALREILADGIETRIARHRQAARALREAWEVLGLVPVPVRPEIAAFTLSALRLPPGVDGSLVGRILERGVAVAGGLHPELRGTSFRVGHMGYAVTRPEMLLRTVRAVGEALADAGRPVDPRAAEAAAAAILDEAPQPKVAG